MRKAAVLLITLASIVLLSASYRTSQPVLAQTPPAGPSAPSTERTDAPTPRAPQSAPPAPPVAAVSADGQRAGVDIDATTRQAATSSARPLSVVPEASNGGPEARAYGAMAFDAATGSTALYGGEDADGFVLGDTWTFNGSAWTAVCGTASTPLCPLSPRLFPAMAYDSVRNRVTLFGGCCYLNDTWAFDGATWTQQSPTTSPPSRDGASMAFDAGNGVAVLFGGFGGNSYCTPTCVNFDDTWTYNGSTWTQQVSQGCTTACPNSPPVQYNSFAAPMAYDASASETVLFVQDQTWSWNGSAWSNQNASPPGRNAASIAYDAAHSQVVLFGGCCSNVGYYNDTWVWNGNIWTQQSPAASPPGRAGPSMAYDSVHNLIVLFGGTGATGVTDDTWTFNGSTWTNAIAPSPLTRPAPRWFGAMTYDADQGRVVLFGGFGALNFELADTWTFDGSAWTQQTPATSPPPLFSPSMVYDPAISAVVLYGSGPTWTWNGTTWTPVCGTSATAACAIPGRVYVGTMAYDAGHGQIVLFGGSSSCGGYCADTWTFNGTTWTQQFPTTSPPARNGGGLAYDAGHAQVVLFGGSNSATCCLNDIWTWNGSTWTQQHPSTSPPGTGYPEMDYDAATSSITLFVNGATWTWNGSAWAQQSPSVSPPSRGDGSLVYDAGLGRAVLFGGCCFFNDTWLWDGSAWSVPGASPQPAVTFVSPNAGPATGGLTVTISGRDLAVPGFSTTISFGSSAATNVVCSSTQCSATAPTGNGAVHVQVNVNGQTSPIVSADLFTYHSPTSPSWALQTPAASPPPSSISTMVYDVATSTTVLWAGSQTWAWNGSTWSELNPATSPPSRGDTSMAYDAATSSVLLFGGNVCTNTCTYFGDTWAFNGDTWTGLCGTPTTPPCGPLGRSGARMADDAAHGQVVLFGGYTGSAYLNDSWAWSGSGWTQLVSPGCTGNCPSSPPAHVEASMAYDAGHGQVILFGGVGCTGSCTVLNDTWAWSGSAWAQLVSPGCAGNCPSSPPTRYGSNMAYDASLGGIVLFSGGCCGLNDTWLWNGTTWTQQFPAVSPSARLYAGLTFDGARQQIVVFGGACGTQGCSRSSALNDTWTFGALAAGTPTVTGVSPNSGPAAGGTAVTISGTNFSTVSGGTTIKFGANAATNVSCSSTSCTSTSPAGTVGAVVDVTATTASGTSPTTSADQFTYTSASTVGVSMQPVRAFAPLPGSGTTNVTLQAQTPSAGLGSWTVDITYNPAIVQVTACSGQNGSQCNATFGNNTVRVTGSASPGLSGSQPLASISFQAAAGVAANSSSPLSPNIVTFTDGLGNPVAGEPFAGTIAIGKLGDVNGDGFVTSVDALCVLRAVAGLPGTTACPSPLPGNPIIALNETGPNPTSVDALCILRGVAGLPATNVCPLITAPVSSPEGAMNHAPTEGPGDGSERGGGPAAELALSPQAIRVTPGASQTVQVHAKALAGSLGAWTVDVGYDPKSVQVTDCKAENGSVCNASFASGVVRITGASASGLSGEQTLATITFGATGRAGSSGSVTEQAATLTDPNGKALAAQTATGNVSIGPPAPPATPGGRERP